MRALVVTDNLNVGQQLRTVLLRNAIECAPTDVVSKDVAAERASRLSPEIAVVVLDRDRDGSLQTLRQVGRTAGCHVFVVGAIDDPQLILRCLHEGASEFVDREHCENHLADAIVRYRSKMARRATPSSAGRVISVVAPSGGSGSSTVAVNVAAALARQYKHVGLLDMRLSTGDLAAFLDLVPPHNIADLAQSLNRMDMTMLDSALARHPSGIHLLAAPSEYSQIASVTDKAVRQTLVLTRRRFPYVVVDLENVLNEEQVEVLWQADVTLMVIRLDYTSLRNAQRLLRHMGEIGLEVDRVRFVVNRYGERRQLKVAQAREVLQCEITDFIPDDPRSINRAINEGLPVVLRRPRAKVSRSFTRLASSINGKKP